MMGEQIMEKFKVPASLNKTFLALIAVGVASLAAGFVLQTDRAWAGLLVLAFYLVSIALFGGFFTALHFISGTKWSVVIRRVPETIVVALLPVAAILIAAVLGGVHHLYEWSHEEVMATDHLLHKKEAYLNVPFFVARVVFYIVVWYVLASTIKKISIQQDTTKDPKTRTTLIKFSTAYMLTFAYFFSLMAIDLVMSLEPHWYTTMFPVYCFAGLAYTGFGVLILITSTIKKHGGLASMNNDHFHDLGKFQLVFTIFWAYIAFSQHMLTWYANLPEETVYLERRVHGVWGYFTGILWFFHFVVPFFILLSSKLKKMPNKLARVAWLTVTMGFVDVVWMVYGGLQHEHVKNFPIGWMEIGLFLGAVGTVGYVVMNAYGKVNPEPVGDPYYEDSIHFHQTH